LLLGLLNSHELLYGVLCLTSSTLKALATAKPDDAIEAALSRQLHLLPDYHDTSETVTWYGPVL
jgi:hypothetical protein